jgi:hypothetical protein
VDHEPTNLNPRSDTVDRNVDDDAVKKGGREGGVRSDEDKENDSREVNTIVTDRGSGSKGDGDVGVDTEPRALSSATAVLDVATEVAEPLTPSTPLAAAESCDDSNPGNHSLSSARRPSAVDCNPTALASMSVTMVPFQASVHQVVTVTSPQGSPRKPMTPIDVA